MTGRIIILQRVKMVLTGQVHGAIETARQVRFRGADDLALSSPAIVPA